MRHHLNAAHAALDLADICLFPLATAVRLGVSLLTAQQLPGLQPHHAAHHQHWAVAIMRAIFIC